MYIYPFSLFQKRITYAQISDVHAYVNIDMKTISIKQELLFDLNFVRQVNVPYYFCGNIITVIRLETSGKWGLRIHLPDSSLSKRNFFATERTE